MSEKGAPIYLFAGGPGMRERRGPDPLFQAALKRTGLRRPRVAYVGAASGDHPEFREWLAGVLQKAGAGEVILAPLCGRRGDAAQAKRVLQTSDVLFISGGDVDEGMRVLREKKIIPFLRKLYHEGRPFLGMSAGSIILARKWIRWPDPDDDASAELFSCLGFASVYCDTHGEDDDWEELKALLVRSPKGTIGYGIISGTAIVCELDGTVSALGGEVHRFQKQKDGVVQIESLFPKKKLTTILKK